MAPPSPPSSSYTSYDDQRSRRYDEYPSTSLPPKRHDYSSSYDYNYHPKPTSRLEPNSSHDFYAKRHVSSPSIDEWTSSSQSRPRSSAPRPRRSWPPSPCCEEEKASLAREAGTPPSSGDERGGPVLHRGSIDQDPLLVEVEQYPRQKKAATSDTHRIPINSKKDGPHQPNTARKVTRIETNVDNQTPEVKARQRAPYAFSSFTPSSKNHLAGDLLLSPESIVPHGHSPRSSHASEDSPRYHHRPPLRKTGSTSSGASSTKTTPRSSLDEAKRQSFESAVDDSDGDDMPMDRGRREPSRYSFTKDELAKKKAGVAARDFAPPENGKYGRPLRSNEAHASKNFSGDSAANRRVPSFDRAKSPAWVPLPPSNNNSDNESLRSYRSERAPGRQRPSILRENSQESPLTPPQSPRAGGRYSPGTRSPQGGSREPSESGSRSGSVHSMQTNSRPNSRPSSPTSGAARAPLPYPVPKSSIPSVHDLGITAGVQPKDPRSHNPSRLSAEVRTGSFPMAPRIDVQEPTSSVQPKAALPYPVDDLPDTSAFFPKADYDAAKLRRSISRSPTFPDRFPAPAPAPAGKDISDDDKVVRPRLNKRHSAVSGVPTVHPSTLPKNPTAYDRDLEDETLAESISKPLPPCPRAEYSYEPDDWYTLTNCPNFDVCSSCFSKVFLRTRYARKFTRAAARPPSAQIKCDFASPWYRLAWLLTLKRKRSTLNGLYDLADNTFEAGAKTCPGDKAAVRSWYCVPDPDTGKAVANFNICSLCVDHVECLLPNLRRCFRSGAAPPSASENALSDSYSPRPCAFAVTSPHFASYMDILIDIDDHASPRHPVNLRPFVSLLRNLPKKNESPATTVSAAPPVIQPPGQKQQQPTRSSTTNSTSSTASSASSSQTAVPAPAPSQSSYPPPPPTSKASATAATASTVNVPPPPPPVKTRRSFPPCARDNMLTSETWHFHPALPEFTVCVACYATVILPYTTSHTRNSTISPASTPGAGIAVRFCRVPQYVEHEPSHGTSCQLYSVRMRRILANSFANNDFTHLARQAVARKNTEARLQRRVRELQGEWDVIEERNLARQEREREKERIERALRGVGEEWKGWE